MKRWAGVLPVAVFTGAYLAVSTIVALSRANYEFLLYIGSILLIVPVIAATHARVGLTRATLWCLSLWGVMHMCGGLVHVPAHWPLQGDSTVLYSLWFIPETLKYDNIVHAFGFGTTTWVCWQGMRAGLGNNADPTWGRMLLVWVAGQGFGALNEVIEFTAVLLVPETNVGGYSNTGWDLVFNIVGCTVAVLLIRRFGYAGSSRDRSNTARRSFS